MEAQKTGVGIDARTPRPCLVRVLQNRHYKRAIVIVWYDFGICLYHQRKVVRFQFVACSVAQFQAEKVGRVRCGPLAGSGNNAIFDLMPHLPCHFIDDFLPEALNGALLRHTLDVSRFASAKVVSSEELKLQTSLRKGMLSEDRLEPFLPQLLASLQQAFPTICTTLGVSGFDNPHIEYRLAAHGDGDFFSAHHDVLTGANRTLTNRDRVVTAVYYFHRLPRAFTGGELHLHPFIKGAAKAIEPRNNRLVAFPSLLMHEVVPVSVPGTAFADSRFSITFWYTRNRGTLSDEHSGIRHRS